MRRAAFLLLLPAVLVAGFAIGRSRAPAPTPASRRVLYYVDPMHPAYRSSKPGIAPDCGMQLTPVYALEQDSQHAPSGAGPGQAHVDAATRQRYGIELTKVEQGPLAKTLHVYGKVAADESLIYRVNLGTEGYVKATDGDAVGNHVTKDQHLATVYSPEFLSVAGGYLSANERSPTGNAKDTQPQNPSGSQARADRLRNLGMSDVQIDEISNSRKLPEDVYVVSPTDGFILSRGISAGMRFEKHTEFYSIADLRHVWILADVFGKDVNAFRPGALARIILPDTGEKFTARVSDLLPAPDPSTHTLHPRLAVTNPAFHLRPEMRVDVEIPVASPTGVTIPTAAVVNGGRAKWVFVQAGESDFAAREIRTGSTFGDRVEVIGGLQPGEVVVSSGTFLVDSESRMHIGSAHPTAASYSALLP